MGSERKVCMVLGRMICRCYFHISHSLEGCLNFTAKSIDRTRFHMQGAVGDILKMAPSFHASATTVSKHYQDGALPGATVDTQILFCCSEWRACFKHSMAVKVLLYGVHMNDTPSTSGGRWAACDSAFPPCACSPLPHFLRAVQGSNASSTTFNSRAFRRAAPLHTFSFAVYALPLPIRRPHLVYG